MWTSLVDFNYDGETYGEPGSKKQRSPPFSRQNRPLHHTHTPYDKKPSYTPYDTIKKAFVWPHPMKIASYEIFFQVDEGSVFTSS